LELKCPECKSRFDIEKAVDAKRQAEVQDIAAKLGEHWQIAYEYTNCFRCSEYSKIQDKTRWRLLKEISGLIDSCVFQLRGKRFRTTKAEIIKAMRVTCNYNKWNLSNHNYLLTILTKAAERISAEGLTAKEELSRELNRSATIRQTDGGQETADKGQGLVRRECGGLVRRECGGLVRRECGGELRKLDIAGIASKLIADSCKQKP